MADSTTDLGTDRKDGDVIAYGVMASTAVPKGVMAVISVADAGYLTATITDPSGNIKFAGVTQESCTPQDSSGNVKIECWKKGIFEFALSGASLADVGKTAYISDNQTVKTTANGAIKVGEIVDYQNANKVFVDIGKRW